MQIANTKSLIKLIFATLLACSIVACSSKNNRERPALLTKLVEPVEAYDLWTLDTRAEENLASYQFRPIVVNQQILTIDADGTVIGTNARTGNLDWRYETDLQAINGLAQSSTGDRIEILATSRDGEVVKFQLADHGLEKLWQQRVGGELRSLPTIDDDQVFVRGVDGRVSALDLSTGIVLWSASGRVPSLSLTGNSSPQISNDLVISGFDNGKLVAFEKESGQTAWEITLSFPDGRTEIDRLVDIDGQFIIRDGIIYVSAYQGRLAAVETRDGNVLWTRDVSNFDAISADEKALYLTDEYSHIWSIDRRTGSALWKQDLLHARDLTAPTVHGDNLVVADYAGFIHWFDKSTGRNIARTRPTNNGVFAPPVEHGEKVLTLDKKGFLSATQLAR